jgi:hypothetical protein
LVSRRAVDVPSWLRSDPAKSWCFGNAVVLAEGKKTGQMQGCVARPLHSEHRLENAQQLSQGCLRQTPQSLDETLPISGPSELARHNMTVFAVKRATHTKWAWMSARWERCNNASAKMSI